MFKYVKGLANNSSSNTYQKYFKLDTDIDLSERIWDIVCSFHGVFDGNGHTISGLKINGALIDYPSTQKEFGLFTSASGYSSSFTTEIKNFILDKPFLYICKDSGTTVYVGSVVANSSIGVKYSNIFVNEPTLRLYVEAGSTSSITTYVGGLVGYFVTDGSITDVDVYDATIENYYEGPQYNGGICGYCDEYHAFLTKYTNINVIGVSFSNGTHGYTSKSRNGGIFGYSGELHLTNASVDTLTYTDLGGDFSGKVYVGGIVGEYFCGLTGNHLELQSILINRCASSKSEPYNFHSLIGEFSGTTTNTSADKTTDGKSCIYINLDGGNVPCNTGISGIDEIDGSSNLSTHIAIRKYINFSNPVQNESFRVYTSPTAYTILKYYIHVSYLPDVLKNVSRNPCCDDNLSHVYFANDYCKNANNYTVYDSVGIDNGLWTNKFGHRDELFHGVNSPILYIVCINKEVQLPVPDYESYRNITLAFYDNDTKMDGVYSPGQKVKITSSRNLSLANQFFFHIIDADVTEPIHYKNSDSVTKSLDNILVKNSRSIIEPIIGHNFKNTSGLL